MKTRTITAAKLDAELRAAQGDAEYGIFPVGLEQLSVELRERLHHHPDDAQAIADEWIAEQRKFPRRRYRLFNGIGITVKRRIRPIVIEDAGRQAMTESSRTIEDTARQILSNFYGPDATTAEDLAAAIAQVRRDPEGSRILAESDAIPGERADLRLARARGIYVQRRPDEPEH